MPALDRLNLEDVQLEPESGIQAVAVSRGAVTATDTISVTSTVEDLDYDGVVFMPRGTVLPKRGDRGVLILDDEGGGWLAAWEPT